MRLNIQRVTIACISAIGLIGASPRAFAWPPLFGPEFTFSSSSLNGNSRVNSRENVSARNKMAELMIEKCKKTGECTVTRSFRRWMTAQDYVITYKDGWSWRISTDPSVVEIQTQPQTLAEFEARSKRVQEDIFGTAQRAGLSPQRNTGAGGHIHIGFASAFDDKPTLFRNFLVDIANFPSLGHILTQGGDPYNAPMLSDLTPQQKQSFAKVIEDFDQGKIKSATELAREIQSKVYHKTPKGWRPPSKYQGVNVNRIVDYEHDPIRQTVELRFVDAQRNFDEFLQQIRLFQKRIEYLEKLPGILKYDANASTENAWAGIVQFKQYVTDSDLNWKEYEHFAVNNPGEPNPYYERFAPPRQKVFPHTEATRTGLHSAPPIKDCAYYYRRTVHTMHPSKLLYFGY